MKLSVRALHLALSFVGIDDVGIIAVTGADTASVNRAHARIADLIHLSARVPNGNPGA
ncbi:MAG TPA: hypothetical protein PKH39_13440 [Woeseiaceae bacterium]|nr:hypothetical protein [Woeseiaceae bacterium]